MQDQVGPAFLGVLSLVFGGYGARTLALAYRTEPFNEWVGEAALGAGSLMLSTLFASCTYWLVRGASTAPL